MLTVLTQMPAFISVNRSGPCPHRPDSPQPEDWVKQLKQLNGGRRYMSSPAVAQAPSHAPATRAAAASAPKPAAPAPARAQTAAASY